MHKIAIACLLVAAACGDSHDKGTVNTASATTSVTNMAQIRTSMSAGNGASAATALQAMTAAGQSIVTPAGQAGRLGLLSTEPSRPDGREQVISGTAECSATSCTFNNYGDDTAGSSWLINGTVSATGDNAKFNLTYKVLTAATSLTWAIDGDVTNSATAIDGNIHSHGVTDIASGSNNPGINVTWDTGLDFNAISVDAQGCATGGDLHAVVAYSAQAGGNGAAFDVEGTAAFGPTCGTVTAK